MFMSALRTLSSFLHVSFKISRSYLILRIVVKRFVYATCTIIIRYPMFASRCSNIAHGTFRGGV